MTVKNKKTGEESAVTSWGVGTNTFRTAIMILVLSMHPFGRALLSTTGFKFPDDQKLTTTSEQAGVLSTKVDELSKDFIRLKEDVKELKSTVQNVQFAVTGFQVDFEKYRKEK